MSFAKALRFLAENYLAELYGKVNAYYDSRWNRWRAKLKRDYFSNPWTIISVIAATVLPGLTVVQALFSVLKFLGDA